MSDTPEHFIAVCPNCLLSLKVNYEYSGRLVRCRHCDEAFRPFSPDFGSASGSGSGSAEYAVGPISGPSSRLELIVSCPSCATRLSVRARYAGRHVRCGACQHKFRVYGDAPLPPPERAPDPAPNGGEAWTPDPDVAPGELARLVHEVDELRERNDLLRGRHDQLKREVERLRARIEQLESDGETTNPRGEHRLALVGLASQANSGDDHRPTFPFPSDRSAVSGR